MDDNEIVWGKPTFEEIREYFTTPSTRVDPRSVCVQPSSDSSIDLDESFKTIIEERRRKAEAEAKKLAQQTPATAKKNLLSLKTPGSRLVFEKTPSTLSMDSDTSSWMNCGDETFLNMEKMCENTVLGDTMEAGAIERLLNEFGVDATPVQNPADLMKNLNDMTQLNDIEAPSMMWEQSILHANSPKASPLKLVHMLRPSTIIEESTIIDSSKEDSKDSVLHQTALLKEDEDSGAASIDLSQSQESQASSDTHISLSSTNDSYETAKAPDTTTNRTSYETANDQTLGGNSSTKTLSDDVNVFSKVKKRNFYDAPFAQSLSISTVSDDSLYNVKYEKNSAFLDSLDVIEVSSKETTKDTFGECTKNDPDDDLLQEDSLLQDDDENINDLPDIPNFNDTLEEMDFIMKHGMKFMEQKAAAKSGSGNKKPSQPNTPTVLKLKNFNSKPLSASKPTPDKKNTPTTFKKPVAISRLPVPKSASKKFDHIVSPIHAYIKDAPQYPLMTKQKGARTGLIDQLHDPNRRDTVYTTNNENLFASDPSYKPTIPLKGVISATKSQVYDARTPIKVPGGEKVHKLIGNHTPSVVKHEGRFKSYANVPINADDTVDESFANLSVASGDVSIQVVKNVNRV